MPVYNFEHNDTKEIWEDTMPYTDKAAYMEEHNCRLIFLQGPAVIGTSKDIFAKSSNEFRDKMTTIKKGYPTKGRNKAKMDGW